MLMGCVQQSWNEKQTVAPGSQPDQLLLQPPRTWQRDWATIMFELLSLAMLSLREQASLFHLLQRARRRQSSVSS